MRLMNLVQCLSNRMEKKVVLMGALIFGVHSVAWCVETDFMSKCQPEVSKGDFLKRACADFDRAEYGISSDPKMKETKKSCESYFGTAYDVLQGYCGYLNAEKEFKEKTAMPAASREQNSRTSQANIADVSQGAKDLHEAFVRAWENDRKTWDSAWDAYKTSIKKLMEGAVKNLGGEMNCNSNQPGMAVPGYVTLALGRKLGPEAWDTYADAVIKIETKARRASEAAEEEAEIFKSAQNRTGGAGSAVPLSPPPPGANNKRPDQTAAFKKAGIAYTVAFVTDEVLHPLEHAIGKAPFGGFAIKQLGFAIEMGAKVVIYKQEIKDLKPFLEVAVNTGIGLAAGAPTAGFSAFFYTLFKEQQEKNKEYARFSIEKIRADESATAAKLKNDWCARQHGN